MVAAFKGELDRKGLEIEIQDEVAVPQIVRCDPNGFRQVLSNLLANAIQSSDRGRIHIALSQTTTTEGNLSIQISVKDEGLRLSEQQLDSIFRDFEHILDDDDPVTTTEAIAEATNTAEDLRTITPGIGLGLATAARFVRLNQGQIIMSSNGAGQGTTVSITIPVRETAEPNIAQRRFASQNLLPTPPTEKPHQPLCTVGSQEFTELRIPQEFTSFLKPMVAYRHQLQHFQLLVKLFPVHLVASQARAGTPFPSLLLRIMGKDSIFWLQKTIH